jgi:molybdate transport system substrate-binding protein
VSRALAALTVVLVLAGCGGSDEEGDAVVFAAASLTDVAPAVDEAATVVLGGSNDLAAQIRDGADADVFASASERVADELHESGAVEEPVVFASNRLVVAVPRGNPAGVEALEDLRRPGLKLVLAGEGVPVGDYARELLVGAGLEAALENVVSFEQDVKGVVGKVALGEADAGIVYATDVDAAGDDVRAIAVDEALQPEIGYHVALVSGGDRDAGRRWIEQLLSADGAQALRDAGFLPVPR